MLNSPPPAADKQEMLTFTQCVVRGFRAGTTLTLLTLVVTILAPRLTPQAAPPRPSDDTSAPRFLLPQLDGAQLSALALRGGRRLDTVFPARLTDEFELQLELDGGPRTLVLRPASLRAPDFELRVQGASGLLAPSNPPPPVSVRGELRGVPGSAAAGALVDGRLQLVLRPGANRAPWALAPLPNGSHALFPIDAVVDAEGECGSYAPHLAGAPAQAVAAAASQPMVAELAIDADFEFYEANGSSLAQTVADIEAVVAATELIYSADVTVSYQLTSITVRTTSDDPYTSFDSGGLLVEFRNHWNAQQGAVPRDLAHLFTGRNLNGSTIGVAYVGVVCNGFSGYGLSQSRFSSNFVRRVGLTAHELGHNWSANHCNGDPDCAIMCSGLGGCSGELEQFGASALASIEQEKSSSGCLSPGVSVDGPVLESVFPGFGPASGGTVLELHGSALPVDPLPLVTLDGVPATVLSASETLLSIETPPGVLGTDADVQLSGPTGFALLEDAFHYDASLVGGDKAKGLVQAGQLDRAYLVAPADAALTLRLKPLVKAEGLLPGLRVVGPGEANLAQVEADPEKPTKTLVIKKLLLPDSGTYRLEVYGLDDSVGSYKLSTKLKPVKSLKQTLAVGPSESEPAVAFSALPGSVLRLAKFKTLKPKGLFAQVEGLPSALLPDLLALEGPDGPIEIEGLLEFAKNAKTVRVRDVALPALGEYELKLGGVDASVGHGKLRVKLKLPKTKKHVLQLDP